MGQAERGVPQDPSLSADRSIGAYLARQRVLRGLSLDDLAGVTRIPRRSLERLEAGAFDGQTDGFARGFVRTVAVALGLDPVDAVTRMLSEPAEKVRPRGHGLLGLWSAHPRVLLAAALLLAGGLGGWLLVQRPSLPQPGGSVDAEVVFRPDPVRALAADRRAREQQAPAPEAPLAVAPGPAAE